MRQLFYSQQDLVTYPLVFLVPTIRKDEIQKEYLTPFGIPEDDVLVCDLHYSQTKKKTPAEEMKQFIKSELLPVLQDSQAKYLIVADSDYFKVLTKSAKTEANLGYMLDCVFGPWKVVYVPSYRAVFYDPEKVRAKIKQGMNALLDHVAGSYQAPGTDIIKYEEYPSGPTEIAAALEKLLAMNVDFTADIEAFDLKHHKAGIGSIALAWNKHEGIAFAVDYEPIDGATEAPYGRNVPNGPVRALLKDFFNRYLKRMIWHNISFDVYVLIYQLYMKDLLDTEGLLEGIDVMLRCWDDTKLITYLATNSCAGNKLGLKDQSQEYSGNYAMNDDDIKDITKIPLPKLLRYNLVDALSTWYVHEKHYQTMVDDQQLNVYQSLFKPATTDIIQMQLTGMPLNMQQVLKVENILTVVYDHALNTIRQCKLIQEYEYTRLERFTEAKNQEWKKKRMTVQEMLTASQTSEAIRKEITFNPNSGPQLQEILFDILEMPVIGLTDSKQPSVDRDTLEALVNHAKTPEVKEFLAAMLDYGAVNKILTSFIPAMKNAALGPDGWHYLFGNFNLGGTLSGRLSSSEPNLQNLPANVEVALVAAVLVLLESMGAGKFIKKGKLHLGKLIKSCFQAPPGWLFCGLDFASLEDRISALTTKDPNKLKVYTDGYDGHSLRAYAYFGSEMPLIRQVEGVRAFRVTQGDEVIYLVQGDTVALPDGTVVNVEDHFTS